MTPRDPLEPTNKERAGWGEKAMEAYAFECGVGDEPEQQQLTDLLTDLRHMSHQKKLRFAEALRLSRERFKEEIQ